MNVLERTLRSLVTFTYRLTPHMITNTYSLMGVYNRIPCLTRVEAKTGIKQRDWLVKNFAFSLPNHVAEFLCSLRVARTNLPGGKLAYKCNLLTCGDVAS